MSDEDATGRERPKRPVLERSVPIRSWGGLVQAPVAEAGTGDAAPDGARIDDVIVRTVELGYRVIDDYVKRGQAAAQRMQHGTYGAGDMARDAQGVAGQLVRSASDLAGAWVEFFALASRDGNGNGHANGAAAAAAAVFQRAPSSPPPAPSAASQSPVGGAAAPESPAGAPAPPETTATPTAAPATWRVRLQVRAACAVETMLDLRPVPIDHALVVHALRGVGAARIDDVRVERHDDGVAIVVVAVAPTLPAGHYTGLVVDDTANVPVGELTVVIPA